MKCADRKLWRPLAWIAAVLILLLPCNAHSTSKGIRLSPSSLSIGTFFGGASLTVSTPIPDGCEVVFEVSGKDVPEDIMRKGRRFELWMNTGEIYIDGVPDLYYVMSSDPDLLSSQGQNLPWGYAELRRNISFRGKQQNVTDDELFKEFIHLKEGEGIYGVFHNTLKKACSGPNGCIAEGTFRFSPRIAAGTYLVSAFIIKNHQVLERRTTHIEVTMTGIPALIRSFSSGNKYLYGILAVVVAAAFGLLSGFVFKRGKGAGSH